MKTLKKYLTSFFILSLSLFIYQGVFAVSGTSSIGTKTSLIEKQKQLKIQKEKRLAEQKAKKEALSKPHFGNGTFIVGKDIQPGTYRTKVASKGCYFIRLSGFGGKFDDIISNEYTNTSAIVTIEPTDKGFKSSNCGTWTQDLSQITKEKTSFTDGAFIVGIDITPGTYKNTGGKGCYYVRLSGFSGTFKDIIANEFTDDSSIIKIESTDKGFKTTNCGTWTKITE